MPEVYVHTVANGRADWNGGSGARRLAQGLLLSLKKFKEVQNIDMLFEDMYEVETMLSVKVPLR